MLTGDENIVDVQFTVQYKIAQIEDYLYNLTNPDETVKSAAESAMREVIGHNRYRCLDRRKSENRIGHRELTSRNSERLQFGLLIGNVKLQDVHPPDQVKEAFKDVVSAREDREKLINEAEGYKNNLIPQARGEAKQIINSAEGYAEQTTLIAEGKANRFNSIFEEYRKAKEITRERIMLETMETVLPKVNKVVADEEVGKTFCLFSPSTNCRKPTKP